MRPALHVLLISGPLYEPLYRCLAAFEAQEGVRVEVTRIGPHSALNAHIRDAFGSGAARYDLLSTHTKYAPSQREYLLPLDDVEVELDAFDPLTLELARIDGLLYGVPRNLDVKLLHHRTDVVPHAPLSWPELVERAAALTGPDRWGFAFPGRGSGLFGHFFELSAMAGAAIFLEDAPVPHVRSEGCRWALEVLQRLYTRASPREALDWEFDEVTACFRSGRAAMTTDWPASFHVYRDPAESAVVDRLGLSLYPPGPAGCRVYAGCHTFAIPCTVRDRRAAVALLRFLTSCTSQVFEARFGTFPARQDARHLARAEAKPGSLEARRWDLLENASRCAIVPPKHPRYPAVEEVIWRAVRRFLRGDLTLEETLKMIEQEGCAVLEEG
jgi:multiple sugar transport system substrate-binding protein